MSGVDHAGSVRRPKMAVGPSYGARGWSASGPYWEPATVLSIIMVMVIGVRLHELVPATGILQPALTSSVGGLALILFNTRYSAIRSAFRYGPFRWAMLYFSWTLVTIPTSLWIGLSVDMLKALLPSVLVFFSLLLCPPRRDTYERILFWFVLAVGAFGLAALTMGTAVNGRVSVGNSYDPNDMAALMAIGLPPAIAVSLRSRGKARLGAVGSSLAMIGALLASGSRGGVLAIGAGVIVMVLGFKGYKRALMTLLIGIAALGAWDAAGPVFRGRLMSLTNLEDDYNTSAQTGRIEVWKRGLGYIQDNPVLGVGIGNFPTAEGHWLRSENRTGRWTAAHNAYLQVFVELGIPGGLIFLGWLMSLLRRAGRRWREKPRTRLTRGGHRPELTASLVSYMVAAIFLSLGYFYMLFALAGIIGLADRAVPLVKAGQGSAGGHGRAGSRPLHPA